MNKLIEQAQSGDTEALDALWERTRAFAFTVSRRFHATAAVGTDDLQQCAWLGFYAAVQKHAGRYHFLTLLDYCIRAECQQALHIRTSKRDPLTVSYDIPAPDGEQAMLDLFIDDALPESDTTLIAADLVRDVRAAVAELPERERMVIELRWLTDEPLSIHATGKRLGVSHEIIRRLERHAFDLLRADSVLRTYATQPPPMRTGLARFMTTHSSGTETAALHLVQQSKRTHAAYADLLASLAAEGFL